MGDKAGKRRGDSELIRVNYCYGDFNFQKIVGLNTARNTLAQKTDLPPLIALCENEKRQRMMFEEEFEPIFPIGQIKEDVFWRLIADNNMPSVILLRDGHVQQIWDEKIPDKDGLKEALS